MDAAFEPRLILPPGGRDHGRAGQAGDTCTPQMLNELADAIVQSSNRGRRA